MNSDLRKTNQHAARRTHRRPVRCLLPRWERKPRNKTRVIELLVRRGVVSS